MIPFARVLKYGNIAPEPVVGKYKKIDCSYQNTLVLGSSGNLYYFGFSAYGEIPSSTNVKTLMASGVEDCWIGGWCSLYKTVDSRFIFNGYSMAVGMAAPAKVLKDEDITAKFLAVTALDQIKKIGVGYRSIYVLTRSGDLYGLGVGENGQMGNGSTALRTQFTLIRGSVSDFATNDNNGLFVLSGGKIYACGSPTYLGIGVNTSSVSVLTEIKLPESYVNSFGDTLDGIFSCTRTGAVLYYADTKQLLSCGFRGGAFLNNGSAAGYGNYDFIVSVLTDDSGVALEYAGKMFGGSGDPMFPAILMRRVNGTNYGYYFSSSNENGIFGIGNNTFQTRFRWSGISESAELIAYQRAALYYAYGDNFFAAGNAASNNSIPGYTGTQYNFVRPVGFLQGDDI